MLFRVGDRVRTLATESRTEESNKVYANRTGVITEISYPGGTVVCYKVKFDKPFYDCGYPIEWHYYYDHQNSLEKMVRME